MNNSKLIISGLILLSFISCNKNQVNGEWLIPREEVFDGGPGKDGIPAGSTTNFNERIYGLLVCLGSFL